jgi:hypothetical protein
MVKARRINYIPCSMVIIKIVDYFDFNTWKDYKNR